jgi:hypothetical protein
MGVDRQEVGDHQSERPEAGPFGKGSSVDRQMMSVPTPGSYGLDPIATGTASRLSLAW